jgi:hypothetical protein
VALAGGVDWLTGHLMPWTVSAAATAGADRGAAA